MPLPFPGQILLTSPLEWTLKGKYLYATSFICFCTCITFVRGTILYSCHSMKCLNQLFLFSTPELMNATPSHTPSRYNMFVKENFSAVKKANPGAPHRDIMKIISQKFHDFKISSSNDKENITPSVTPL